MKISLTAAGCATVLVGIWIAVAQADAHSGHASSAPQPVARTRIQVGPPPSQRLLKMWRAELFTFAPLPPPGRNVDALQAIHAADGAFVRSRNAYVFAVRYGRMTNPRESDSSGLEWVVMYQHDTPMATACAAHGCPPSALHRRSRFAQTNAVIDAKTGHALFKFQT